MPELPSLAHEPWLRDERLQFLLRTLNERGTARVAGGAVRNALLGVPVADVDVATTMAPQQVMDLCSAAGFGVHPTGLEHGTITVSQSGAAFEVTTLRRDVATDGRRAVVAFTQDWAEDAHRRDFTMNALYCSADGEIFDFTNGYEDIRKRRVRFVGAPSTRIREDYLRILRFFRFHAHYGRGTLDEPGSKACARLRKGLDKLSAERITQEMFKLLAAHNPIPVLKTMQALGVLQHCLQGQPDWRTFRRLPSDVLQRLYVLNGKSASVGLRFRLGRQQQKRLDDLQQAPDLSPALRQAEQKRLLYSLGPTRFADAVAVAWAGSKAPPESPDWKALQDLPVQWSPPAFPVNGDDLRGMGFEPGPALGATLAALEDWWLASDFAPSRDDLLARANRYKPERE